MSKIIGIETEASLIRNPVLYPTVHYPNISVLDVSRWGNVRPKVGDEVTIATEAVAMPSPGEKGTFKAWTVKIGSVIGQNLVSYSGFALADKIIGVDPGTHEGAYVTLDTNTKSVVDKGFLPNHALLDFLRQQDTVGLIFIEKLTCYGMPVGAETFETAYWIGRAQEICARRGVAAALVARLDVKVHHCHTAKAKDANIRQALLDRCGPVGTKGQPGPLYGIATHLWSALAIALYASDIYAPSR